MNPAAAAMRAACSPSAVPRPPASTPSIFTPASRKKCVEETDGVRTAADAGDQQVGQAPFGFQNLLARFDADDAMKIAHHHGIGMRAENRTEQVVRRAHVGDPVAHGFVDRVLQRAAAGIHANHFRAQQCACEKR